MRRSALSLIATVFIAAPGAAQNWVRSCSFNGRSERCTVLQWTAAQATGSQDNLLVNWLSDGKATMYSLEVGGAARIWEDNGRFTPATWSWQGGRYVIRSSRGNITSLPPR